MRIKLQHATRANNVINDDPDAEFFYFEIQADGNYETILTSEIYNSHQAAMHAIDLLCFSGFQAELHDLTAHSSPPADLADDD